MIALLEHLKGNVAVVVAFAVDLENCVLLPQLDQLPLYQFWEGFVLDRLLTRSWLKAKLFQQPIFVNTDELNGGDLTSKLLGIPIDGEDGGKYIVQDDFVQEFNMGPIEVEIPTIVL